MYIHVHILPISKMCMDVDIAFDHIAIWIIFGLIVQL